MTFREGQQTNPRLGSHPLSRHDEHLAVVAAVPLTRGKRAGGVVAYPPVFDLEHRSETSSGWDHRGRSRVNGVDDLGAVDPL
jgi:hypothetical protein